MNYIIIEAQTNGGITIFTTPVVKGSFFEAEQVYHKSLAAAAVSQVPLHAVSMLTERGQLVKYECYDHQEEPAE